MIRLASDVEKPKRCFIKSDHKIREGRSFAFAAMVRFKGSPVLTEYAFSVGDESSPGSKAASAHARRREQVRRAQRYARYLKAPFV